MEEIASMEYGKILFHSISYHALLEMRPCSAWLVYGTESPSQSTLLKNLRFFNIVLMFSSSSSLKYWALK